MRASESVRIASKPGPSCIRGRGDCMEVLWKLMPGGSRMAEDIVSGVL